MEKKKLKFDLDFLGEGTQERSDKKTESEAPSPRVETTKEAENISSRTGWIMGIGTVIFFLVITILPIAWVALGSPGAETDYEKPELITDISTPTSTSPLPREEVVPKKVIAPIPKTANQICKDSYGSHSYSTGRKKPDGSPICECNEGYTWNNSQTACIAVPAAKTGLEYCQEQQGAHASYDSVSNSCGCEDGYNYGVSSHQCVSFATARNEGCASSYPGTSFLKYDPTSGKNICECKAGYDWNDERTACYTAASFNQSCVSSFGQGSYSAIENGKRVCDCGAGYDWNIERNACVTTASINTLCERDVGRNSRYSGTVSDGKYQCTEPY